MEKWATQENPDKMREENNDAERGDEMNTRGVFLSQTDEWSTPQWLFDQLDAEFHFDLDPCSTDENHKCERYFTKADDGLKKSWGGGARYSAIPHTEDRLANGCRRLMKRLKSRTPLWFC